MHRDPPRIHPPAGSAVVGSVVAGSPPPGMLRDNVVHGSVRGGGRLYHASPVEGYSEAEMITAARQRLRYNRQRAALKSMLSIFDDHRTGIPGVMDKQQFDRTLKASLLKADSRTPLGQHTVSRTPPLPEHHIVSRDCAGRPIKVAWRDFVDSSLAYPTVPPPSYPPFGYKAPRPTSGSWRRPTL